jgi:hypothetical protein
MSDHEVKDPGTCQSCGQANQSSYPAAGKFIYAIGKIEPRFPNQAIEKEYKQIVRRTDAQNLTDRQTMHKVFSQRENRYIVRQSCWVLSIEGLETYLVVPRDPFDLDLLIESLRPTPSKMDIDVVIGMRGPNATSEMCNGLPLPIVLMDQLYSFDHMELIRSMPVPKDKDPEVFRHAADELLDRVMQLADNAGASDNHRALNYLAVRYPAIYTRVAEAFEENFSLSCVDVSASPLSSARTIVDVVFSFTSRKSDMTEKSFVRVDVSGEFPFLVTKLSPYYDR